MAAFVLVVVGAINWGLFGLIPTPDGYGFDLVQFIFGGIPTLAEIVYVLIGASGVYLVATHMKDCKICSTASK